MADSRIEVLLQQQKETSKLQEKYALDLGQITVEADREANGLRKEKRFLQDEINKLERRLTSLITGSQELTNELNRYKILTKDLSLEKLEHEIEIERLQMQLSMYPGATAGNKCNNRRILSHASNVMPICATTIQGGSTDVSSPAVGTGVTPSSRRSSHSDEDLSVKMPSVFKKLTENQMIT